MSDTAHVTPVETPVMPAASPMSLQDLSGEQRDHWLKTGDLPDAAPVTEAPAADAGTTNPDDVNAPVAATPVATEQKPPKPRNDINARLGQLTERAKAAERERDELKARLESHPLALVPAPVAPAPPKPATHAELVKRYQQEPDWPKLADFANDPDFAEDAYGATLAAQAAYIGERQWAERQQTQAREAEQTRVYSAVDRTMAGLKAEFPDADPHALRDLTGPGAATFAQLLFESDLSVKLLNYFSNNPAEARAVAAMGPLAAAKVIGKVESQLSTSAPSRVATPTKTLSDAPAPPQTLGDRHTPNAGDEVEAAIRDGDTGRYIEAENKREYARMKAGQR